MAVDSTFLNAVAPWMLDGRQINVVNLLGKIWTTIILIFLQFTYVLKFCRFLILRIIYCGNPKNAKFLPLRFYQPSNLLLLSMCHLGLFLFKDTGMTNYNTLLVKTMMYDLSLRIVTKTKSSTSDQNTKFSGSFQEVLVIQFYFYNTNNWSDGNLKHWPHEHGLLLLIIPLDKNKTRLVC